MHLQLMAMIQIKIWYLLFLSHKMRFIHKIVIQLQKMSKQKKRMKVKILNLRKVKGMIRMTRSMMKKMRMNRKKKMRQIRKKIKIIKFLIKSKFQMIKQKFKIKDCPSSLQKNLKKYKLNQKILYNKKNKYQNKAQIGTNR